MKASGLFEIFYRHGNIGGIKAYPKNRIFFAGKQGFYDWIPKLRNHPFLGTPLFYLDW